MNVSSVLDTPTIPNFTNWTSNGAFKRASGPGRLVGEDLGCLCSTDIHRQDER
jgi:hypothetical protein